MSPLLEQIKELRSNEANFNQLYGKLEEEIASGNKPEKYIAALQEVKEKAAEAYKLAKEKGGTTWPEFEKFAADFEKAVLQFAKEQG